VILPNQGIFTPPKRLIYIDLKKFPVRKWYLVTFCDLPSQILKSTNNQCEYVLNSFWRTLRSQVTGLERMMIAEKLNQLKSDDWSTFVTKYDVHPPHLLSTIYKPLKEEKKKKKKVQFVFVLKFPTVFKNIFWSNLLTVSVSETIQRLSKLRGVTGRVVQSQQSHFWHIHHKKSGF